MSDKDHDFGSLVCIYAQLLPKIREAAKRLGYAIAIHGSMHRDLDLLAVPWTEGAESAEVLVEMIAEAVHGYVIGDVTSRGTVDDPTLQPHGRRSWNICWGGRPIIDLSVMPCEKALRAIKGEGLIEACERETGHAQVPGTAFCRCTHAMFDGETEPALAPEIESALIAGARCQDLNLRPLLSRCMSLLEGVLAAYGRQGNGAIVSVLDDLREALGEEEARRRTEKRVFVMNAQEPFDQRWNSQIPKPPVQKGTIRRGWRLGQEAERERCVASVRAVADDAESRGCPEVASLIDWIADCLALGKSPEETLAAVGVRSLMSEASEEPEKGGASRLDEMARLRGYPDAAAVPPGECVICGWRDGKHALSCDYYQEPHHGQPRPYA